jgi:hypothetical protein
MNEEDLVLPVTSGTIGGERIPTRGSLPMDASALLLRLLIVAETAINGLQLLIMGELGVGQILVARNTVKISMHGSTKAFDVDVERDLGILHHAGQVGILVTDKAIADILPKGWNAECTQ